MHHNAQVTPRTKSLIEGDPAQIVAQPARHRRQETAPYETPPGAKARTLELTVDSSYEMWLLITSTGHAGEDLWVSSFLPFRPIEMKLTYRPGTLELPEVRWLVGRIFQFELGSKTLRWAAGEEDCAAIRSPRPDVLLKVAAQIHMYLDDYDVVALAQNIEASDRVRMNVATKAIPPVSDTAAFEAHVEACIQCVRLTYLDDSFKR